MTYAKIFRTSYYYKNLPTDKNLVFDYSCLEENSRLKSGALFPTTVGISNASGSEGPKPTRSAKQTLSQIFGRISKLLDALSRDGSSDRMGSRNMVGNVTLDKKVEIFFFEITLCQKMQCIC